jgi:hypothetical protein
MSLQDQFQAQKQGAAELLYALFGQNSAELATTLERELGEQARYDHRQEEVAALDSIWQSVPPIASWVGHGNPADLEPLKASSYAFRLMTLAQCLKHLPKESDAAFRAILDEFGLGIKEVEAYVKDFVR